MEKPESISLYFKEGSSDKEYNAYLEGTGSKWTVKFAYGRRGNTLTAGTKTPKPVPYEKAKKIYDKLVHSKIAKGYTEDTNGTPNLTAVEGKVHSGWIPQLLNEIEEAEVEKFLKDPEWCAQQKFDGRNRLLIRTDDKVTGANRHGFEVAIPQEVVDDFDNISECVLAGEAIGDQVMVWDAIHLKGVPYKERIDATRHLVKNCKNVRAVTTAYTEEEKRALLKAIKENGDEGIVFKNLLAHYTPGRPASGGSQLKYKLVSTASVIAGAMTPGKRSVEMWMYDENAVRVNVGNVTVYPNMSIPKRGEILEVKYLYAYKEGSLFQPVLLGVRDDIDPFACETKQLKYKQEEVKI